MGCGTVSLCSIPALRSGIEHKLRGCGGTVGGVDDALTDEELAELALAADPDAPLPRDAVPIQTRDRDELLPEWYMPAPTSGARPGWRRRIAITAVSSILLINAAGLCVTYGPVTFG